MLYVVCCVFYVVYLCFVLYVVCLYCMFYVVCCIFSVVFVFQGEVKLAPSPQHLLTSESNVLILSVTYFDS
jgi:hypothetical protein